MLVRVPKNIAGTIVHEEWRERQCAATRAFVAYFDKLLGADSCVRWDKAFAPWRLCHATSCGLWLRRRTHLF